MKKTSTLILSNLVLLSLVGCSSDPPTTPELPGCPSGNCGREPFRVAVPTRADVRLSSPTKARRHVALEAISPALLSVEDHIDEVNEVIDEVFGELEAAAGT